MTPRSIRALLAAALLAAPMAYAQDNTEPQVYGWQMMTPAERDEFRAKMRSAQTPEERERIRAEHHALMRERAKERGLAMPEEPPARGMGGMGGGMGPSGPMGPGMGGGMGRGGMGR
jgi:Ni/Co efflux regulator RcnB